MAGVIRPQALRAHVERMAADIGERHLLRPRALGDAAAYVTDEWRRQGYQVLPQTYEAHGVPCSNLEVTRPGTRRPEEMIVVGAHYDSVPGSPGADDNASGVAALLEISRRLVGVEPERTLRFVAFVNEEPPWFATGVMGSHVYARAALARGDDIRLMLCLESVGYYRDAPGTQYLPPLFNLCYPDRANFVAFVSNLRSRRWLRRTVALFRAHSDVPAERLAALPLIPGVDWSDHRSFWRHGYRALMITDTAPYRYPWYHTAGDTPDRLDYDVLARVTGGLAATIVALDSGE